MQQNRLDLLAGEGEYLNGEGNTFVESSLIVDILCVYHILILP